MNSAIQAFDFRRLTYTLFNNSEATQSRRSTVVAVTSPTRGEGVTYVSQLLSRELSRDQIGRTLYCTSGDLASASLENDKVQSVSAKSGGWRLTPRGDEGNAAWEFNPSARCARIETLRQRFEYIIVDCPAVCVSGDISGVASLTDGVLLVVAAGCSSKRQIDYARGVIDEAGGTLKGCVLNRRTYPIPNFLHSILKG